MADSMIRSIGMLLLLMAAAYGIYAAFFDPHSSTALRPLSREDNLSPLIQRLLTMIEKNGGLDGAQKGLPYSIQQSVNVNPGQGKVVPKKRRAVRAPIRRPRRPSIPKVSPRTPTAAGPYRVQAGVCYFKACTESYRQLLEQEALKVVVEERRRTMDVFEVISKDKFSNSGEASVLALQVNKENLLEGRAYVRQLDGGYVISLGQFPSRARANRVVFALNRQFEEAVIFTTRAGKAPYSVQLVLGGDYPTREQAEAVLTTLRNKYDQFAEARVTKL